MRCPRCTGEWTNAEAFDEHVRIGGGDCFPPVAIPRPPPGSWRDFHLPALDQRDWYEFDLARELDPLMEAGHA